MTPGVKKILLSQKTFANHLADQEAAIALRAEETASKSATRQPPTKSKRRSSGVHASISTSVDTETADARNFKEVSDPSTINESQEQSEHPLLKINLPATPTEEEISALISTEPLSYNAARVGPTKSTAPPRQFCEICGYWGRARCMKCGVRICDLECQRQHDETSCQKFWA